ncbi:hypothetical protein ACFVS2_25730 [Brevibacillus sp. NPDC058079]|uniref:hypothetical protein n=1 Tax=Brevibacillus sp. NPDC058079 TaxID=3346330 RepID=UPI0036E4FCA3
MKMDRISIHTQGEWLVYKKEDWFVIYYGENDEDVQIYPSAYYTKKFGSRELPRALQQELEQIGIHFDEYVGEYYYSRIDGISISDKMKKKIENILLNFTQVNS